MYVCMYVYTYTCTHAHAHTPTRTHMLKLKLPHAQNVSMWSIVIFEGCFADPVKSCLDNDTYGGHLLGLVPGTAPIAS